MTKRKSYIDENGDALELDEQFFREAIRGRPEMLLKDRKQSITARLDRDIIAKLKEDGRGWQTRMNAVLREALDLKETG